jgi:hypothetical protein
MSPTLVIALTLALALVPDYGSRFGSWVISLVNGYSSSSCFWLIDSFITEALSLTLYYEISRSES